MFVQFRESLLYMYTRFLHMLKGGNLPVSVVTYSRASKFHGATVTAVTPMACLTTSDSLSATVCMLWQFLSAQFSPAPTLWDRFYVVFSFCQGLFIKTQASISGCFFIMNRQELKKMYIVIKLCFQFKFSSCKLFCFRG